MCFLLFLAFSPQSVPMHLIVYILIGGDDGDNDLSLVYSYSYQQDA